MKNQKTTKTQFIAELEVRDGAMRASADKLARMRQDAQDDAQARQLYLAERKLCTNARYDGALAMLSDKALNYAQRLGLLDGALALSNAYARMKILGAFEACASKDASRLLVAWENKRDLQLYAFMLTASNGKHIPNADARLRHYSRKTRTMEEVQALGLDATKLHNWLSDAPHDGATQARQCLQVLVTLGALVRVGRGPEAHHEWLDTPFSRDLRALFE